MPRVAIAFALLLMMSMFAGIAVAQAGHEIVYEILDTDAIPIPVRLTLVGSGLEDFQTYEAVRVIWIVAGETTVVNNAIDVVVEFSDFGRYEVSAEYYFNGRLEDTVEETVVISQDLYQDTKARTQYGLFRSATTIIVIIAIVGFASAFIADFHRREFFIAVVATGAFTISVWIMPDAWIALIRLIMFSEGG